MRVGEGGEQEGEQGEQEEEVRMHGGRRVGGLVGGAGWGRGVWELFKGGIVGNGGCVDSGSVTRCW